VDGVEDAVVRVLVAHRATGLLKDVILDEHKSDLYIKPSYVLTV
jgi:hypothetical protein